MVSEHKKREILWVLGISAFLIVSTGVVLELDLWVSLENTLDTEFVWIVSALFIASFIIIAGILHHHKIAKRYGRHSAVHEFMRMSPIGKACLLIFVITLALMIVAIVLTRVAGVSLGPIEEGEEWIIILLALLSYVALIVETIRMPGGA